jgi:hypothetical protein
VDTSDEAVFTSEELAGLEPIVALPTWREASFADTFLEARRHLREASVPGASSEAFHVASLAIFDPVSRHLRNRADATRSALAPGSRQPLGHLYARVGARMAAQPTLLEHTLGLLMMKRGAEDRHDTAEELRADALLEEVHATHREWRKAALDRWPLPSLLEENLEASARDELAFLRTFLPHSSTPG